MTVKADLILLQAQVAAPLTTAEADADVRRFCAASALLPRRIAWAAAQRAVYVYVAPPAGAAAFDELTQAFARHCPWATGVRASPLEQVFDTPGISHGAPVSFHYVVETDPEDGWMPEIARWYDTEHMPGLAAVPGCIRATRFLNHGHGPISLACYDLTHAEALGSPPWLAVRATQWSDIARPHFTNTKRTMFEVARSSANA